MVVSIDMKEDNGDSSIIENNSVEKNMYWGNKTNEVSKPKFTYDDILSSLNLSVSSDGVLRRMSFKQEGELENKNVKAVRFENNTSVDPGVKHSYIFNKYFKNYKETGETIVPRVPKTREEYRQMIIEDLIKRKQAKERIAVIKSKKMLYTNNNNNPHLNSNLQPINVNRNNLNKLFRIK